MPSRPTIRNPLARPLRAVALALVTAVAVSLGACGGTPTFDRSEFVKEMVARGVKPSLANCAYDGIARDEKVQADLVEAGGPTKRIPEATSDKLSRVMADCIIAASKQPSKSAPRSSTTR
ncbi:MAG: hypothetical protein R2698_13150 [Microthrixaceae bacterium]